MSPRERRNENSSGLSLPPRIYDRNFPFSNMGVIPQPRLGIDRFPYGPENTEARKTMLFHPLFAFLHERADCGRRRIKDIYLVLVDDFPETVGFRVSRHALEHEARSADRERAVHDIAVAS